MLKSGSQNRGFSMSAKSKKWKTENSFFINSKTNKIQFNKKCKKCMHECKQSYRAEIVACKDYTKKVGK